jgi:hypothetical protein
MNKTQSGCHNGTYLGFCSFTKKKKIFSAWIIGENSMRLTCLEIPQKTFPYKFLLKMVLGSQIGFLMAENGV